MPKPTWFDWITVAAIILGPILALLAQRALDWLREKKQRRVQIYTTLMALRSNPLHPDHVRALNSIDAIFDRRKDSTVREMWGRVLAHLATDVNTSGWQERLIDLRVDLYQAVGRAVGYDHTIEYIKNRIYNPSLYNDIDVETLLIRKGLAHSVTNNGLRVILVEPGQPSQPVQAPAQPEAPRAVAPPQR